jgi:hypothetical protein
VKKTNDSLASRVLKILAYGWASPYTLLGLAIGLGLGGRLRWVEGVFEIQGRGVAWLLNRMPVRAAAMTMGHTVLGVDLRLLEKTRRHERVHVRQFERWGFLMGPAYVLASVYLFLRGRDFYRDNPFEVEAYRVEKEES